MLAPLLGSSEPRETQEEFMIEVSNDPEPWIAAMLALLGVIALVQFAIAVLICWLVYDALGAVPREHRKLEPGLVWLLLIPCWNVIWAFFVFPPVARSFAGAFAARGITTEGDAGESLGLWLAICGAALFVPILNWFAGVAYLVLLILFLVKVRASKAKLLAAA